MKKNFKSRQSKDVKKQQERLSSIEAVIQTEPDPDVSDEYTARHAVTRTLTTELQGDINETSNFNLRERRRLRKRLNTNANDINTLENQYMTASQEARERAQQDGQTTNAYQQPPTQQYYSMPASNTGYGQPSTPYGYTTSYDPYSQPSTQPFPRSSIQSSVETDYGSNARSRYYDEQDDNLNPQGSVAPNPYAPGFSHYQAQSNYQYAHPSTQQSYQPTAYYAHPYAQPGTTSSAVAPYSVPNTNRDYMGSPYDNNPRPRGY